MNEVVPDKDSILNEKGIEHDINRIKEPVNNYKWGRNEPCFCGSGKKYKKCCMDLVNNDNNN